eukprot:56743-Chlamydomonas_euryale.AAC.3
MRAHVVVFRKPCTARQSTGFRELRLWTLPRFLHCVLPSWSSGCVRDPRGGSLAAFRRQCRVTLHMYLLETSQDLGRYLFDTHVVVVESC